MIASQADHRERTEADVRLAEAEEPYHHLVEQMQEGAVLLTRRGEILYSSARFAALVGEPVVSVVGGRIDRFVNASDREGFETLLRAGSGRRRSRLIGADSSAVEVSLSLTVTASPSGDCLNLIVTDVGALLEAQSNCDRAVRENRTEGEFLAMLAHEESARRYWECRPAARADAGRGGARDPRA